jgi:hypothetical protein
MARARSDRELVAGSDGCTAANGLNEVEENDEDNAKIQRIADAIWQNKYQYVNITLYFLYLLLVSFQAVTILVPNQSGMAASAMRQRFEAPETSTSGITVTDISCAADVWEWLVEVLVPNAFIDDRYSARYR